MTVASFAIFAGAAAKGRSISGEFCANAPPAKASTPKAIGIMRFIDNLQLIGPDRVSVYPNAADAEQLVNLNYGRVAFCCRAKDSGGNGGGGVRSSGGSGPAARSQRESI